MRGERDAFFSLIGNPNIIIRSVDKGLGIAIFDKDDHIKNYVLK
jgi:hypothetical protein